MTNKLTRKVKVFKVILEPAEEGGYTVYVPSIKGCVSEGDTEEEALKNIKEAIELLQKEDPDVGLKLSKEAIKVIEEAKKRIKEGKYLTHEEVMKRFGL